MNKITSGLISVFALGLVFLNAGVAWGAGQQCSTEVECDFGQVLNPETCSCEESPQQSVFDDEAKCGAQNITGKPDRYRYENGECVDLALDCVGGTKLWDYEKNICVEGDVYCSEKGAGLKWDSVAQICYNEQQGTLLPATDISETECEALFTYDAMHLGVLKSIISGELKDLSPQTFVSGSNDVSPVTPLDVLGCAIKTGRIKLWMIPFYIKYLIQFALGLAGLVAVGALVIGGYFYLFSGMVDDKEKGKKAIMYGIGGFIIAILAWTIVNAIIAIATR